MSASFVIPSTLAICQRIRRQFYCLQDTLRKNLKAMLGFANCSQKKSIASVSRQQTIGRYQNSQFITSCISQPLSKYVKYSALSPVSLNVEYIIYYIMIYNIYIVRYKQQRAACFFCLAVFFVVYYISVVCVSTTMNHKQYSLLTISRTTMFISYIIYSPH